eukprot:COSAG01_NODE_2515_length_7529_cov_77.394347_2_plen_72_part_00
MVPRLSPSRHAVGRRQSSRGTILSVTSTGAQLRRVLLDIAVTGVLFSMCPALDAVASYQNLQFGQVPMARQ